MHNKLGKLFRILKSTSGHDDKYQDIINIPELSIPLLTKLINVVLVEGKFPNALKVGKIIPTLKYGNECDSNNNRPLL